MCIALASMTPKLVFPDTFSKDKDNIASVLMDLPDCLSTPHSIMECVSLITGADVVTQTAILIPTMSLQQIIILFLVSFYFDECQSQLRQDFTKSIV